MNCENNNKTIVGSEIKLNISLCLPGNLTMDDIEFSAKFYIYSNKVQTVKKKDMVRVDENNYVCLVDTAVTGNGNIKCQVETYIPDSNSTGGFRTEIIKIETDQNIESGLC